MLPIKRIRSQNEASPDTPQKVIKHDETNNKPILISKLPSHVLMHIFNFLDHSLLTTILSRICKTFNYILMIYPGLITHYELDVWQSSNPRNIKIKFPSIKKLNSYYNIEKITFQFQDMAGKVAKLKEFSIPKLLENIYNFRSIKIFYSEIPCNSEESIMELLDNFTSLRILKLGLKDSSAMFISYIMGNILLSRKILEVFNIAYTKKPIIRFGVDEELDIDNPFDTRKIATYDLFRNNRNAHDGITLNTDFSRLRTLKLPDFLAFSKEDAYLFCNILIKMENNLEILKINSSILYGSELFLMFLDRNDKLKVLILDMNSRQKEKFMTIETILELNNAVSTTNIRKYKISSKEKIFHTENDDMEDDFSHKAESSGSKFIKSLEDLLQHSCVENLILEMPELSESVKAHITDSIIFHIKKGKLIEFNGYKIKDIRSNIDDYIFLHFKQRQYYESALFFKVFMHIISEQIPEILSNHNKDTALSVLSSSFLHDFENTHTLSFIESQDINIKVLYLALVLYKPHFFTCGAHQKTDKIYIENDSSKVKRSLNPIDYLKMYTSETIKTLNVDQNFSTFFLFIIPSTLPFYQKLQIFTITIPELKEKQAIIINNLLFTNLLQMHNIVDLTVISKYIIKGIEPTLNILMTFKSLTNLTLNNISITEKIIIGENLTKLDFSYCLFTDENFVNLAECVKVSKKLVSLVLMNVKIVYQPIILVNLNIFSQFLQIMSSKGDLEEISLRIMDLEKVLFKAPNHLCNLIITSIETLLNNSPKLKVLNLIFPFNQKYLMTYSSLISSYLMKNPGLEVFNYTNLKQDYLKLLYEQFTSLYNNEKILDISDYRVDCIKTNNIKYTFYGVVSIVSFLSIFSLIRAKGLDYEIRKIALNNGVIIEKFSQYRKLEIKNKNYCKKLTFHYICLGLFPNIEKLVFYKTNFLHLDNEILNSCFSQMPCLKILKLNQVMTKNLDFSILLTPQNLNHLIFKNMNMEKINLSFFSQRLLTISSLSFKSIRRSEKLKYGFNVANFFSNISFPTLKNLQLDFFISPEEMLSALGAINSLCLTYLMLQVKNDWDKFKLPIHLISKLLGNCDGKLKIFQVNNYVWNMPLIVDKLPIFSIKEHTFGIMDMTILESLISKEEIIKVDTLEIRLDQEVFENNIQETRRIFGNEKVGKIDLVADFESEVLEELKEEFKEKIIRSD